MIYKVEALANIRSVKYLNWVEQSSSDLDCTYDFASNDSRSPEENYYTFWYLQRPDRCAIKEKNSVSVDL